MSSIKIVVERHPDGYVAYPVGLKGVVVGDSEVIEASLTETDVAAE